LSGFLLIIVGYRDVFVAIKKYCRSRGWTMWLYFCTVCSGDPERTNEIVIPFNPGNIGISGPEGNARIRSLQCCRFSEWDDESAFPLVKKKRYDKKVVKKASHKKTQMDV
jgi:hypothetical protein